MQHWAKRKYFLSNFFLKKAPGNEADRMHKSDADKYWGRRKVENILMQTIDLNITFL